MRRRAGVGAIQKQKLAQEKFKDKGTELEQSQLEQMSKQMEVLRTNLEEFASKHRNEIKKNSTFRKQFQEMCASIGVDPLASGKGFWSVLNLGDFYYELSVQIVEVCLATSEKNGGLIALEELRERLIRGRGRNKQHENITQDDLLVAAKKLKIFGNGFTVLSVGKGKYMVQSIPGELSMDQTMILSQTSALGTGWVSKSILKDNLGWEETRANRALSSLISSGLTWLDSCRTEEDRYWFPSLFQACVTS